MIFIYSFKGNIKCVYSVYIVLIIVINKVKNSIILSFFNIERFTKKKLKCLHLYKNNNSMSYSFEFSSSYSFLFSSLFSFSSSSSSTFS